MRDKSTVWKQMFLTLIAPKRVLVSLGEAGSVALKRLLRSTMMRRVLVALGAIGSVASIASLALVFLPAEEKYVPASPTVDVSGIDQQREDEPEVSERPGTYAQPDSVPAVLQGNLDNVVSDLSAESDLSSEGERAVWPRVGEAFELEAGQQVTLQEIQASFVFQLEEVGTLREEVLRVSVTPSGAGEISRDLIGRSGQMDFTSDGQYFRVSITRLGSQVSFPRVRFIVERKGDYFD